MSRYVKDLIARDLKNRFAGVSEAILVNVVGMDVNRSVLLRRHLRAQGIHLMVVKNSLAQRATEGTPLAAAFDPVEGSLAIWWGGSAVVALAKTVSRLADDRDLAPFATCGGVLDGKRLSADEVRAVSKWPSREEQIGLLAGQLGAPAAQLAAQLRGPGARLASQIKPQGDDRTESTADEAVCPS